MKKLEDIPKNTPFTVPDGYFDKLPGIIQARVAERAAKQARPYFRYALQYAMPVAALIVIAILYFTPQATESAESILASVDTEQITFYLADSDVTTDEILDEADLDEESAEAIEAEVYFNDIDLSDFDELDL